MFRKAVFPGKYIQGVGAIKELPPLIDLLGKHGLILASPSVNGKVLPHCGIDLDARGIHTESFRGECCESELSRLSTIMKQRHVDVLVGMGGGKTIDTAKIAADRAGLPVIIIPTIASTDAPCRKRDFRVRILSEIEPGSSAGRRGHHRCGPHTISCGWDGRRSVDVV